MIPALFFVSGLFLGWATAFIVWPWALRTKLGQKLTARYRPQRPSYPKETFDNVQVRHEAVKALGPGARYEESSDGKSVGLLVAHPERQSFFTRVPRLQLQRGRQAIVAKLRDPAFVKSLEKKPAPETKDRGPQK